LAPSVCFEDPTLFSDNSTLAAGLITEWYWDFGDGSSAIVANPSHTFSSPGTKRVKLVVTSVGGCKDSITKNVTVHHLPVALFETQPQCENLDVNFTHNSYSQSGNLSLYAWNFGDGIGTSFNSNPDYDYTQPGYYSVTLRVQSQFG